jgi:hypothetical protein
MRPLQARACKRNKPITKIPSRARRRLAALSATFVAPAAFGQSPSPQLGREVAIPVHLQDGEKFTTPIEQLIRYGARLFSAKFAARNTCCAWPASGTLSNHSLLRALRL